jgi:Cytochrome C assembly protein
MFAKVTVICIASSYAVALGMELARLFFRLPIRVGLILGFTFAGLLAHTIVLWRDSQAGFAAGVPFSSWHLWFLLAAWLLTLVYLGLAWSRPQQSALGIFMLPVMLGLVGVAHTANEQHFEQREAAQAWGAFHGIALLLGTVTMTLGFVAGIMYLVQSYRLKHKLPPHAGFRLPSLEWLQHANKHALYWSSFFVACGMMAGIVLNILRKNVAWTDGVVISSSALLLWLFIASLFELFYKPAQQGRKVAYLTVASFIFLAMVLAFSLSSSAPHGTTKASPAQSGEIP